MDQQVRHDLAERIRGFFIDTRRKYERLKTGVPSAYTPGPRWDGGKSRGGRDFAESYWLKVADFVLKNEVDYPDFIDFIFERQKARRVYSLKEAFPQPNFLVSESILDEYKVQRGPRQKFRMMDVLSSQKTEAAAAIAKYKKMSTLYTDRQSIVRAVITDSSLHLSALFRYCLAEDENQRDLMDYYEEQAMRQYVLKPALYDQVWGSWITPQFKQKVESSFGVYGDRNGTRTAS